MNDCSKYKLLFFSQTGNLLETRKQLITVAVESPALWLDIYLVQGRVKYSSSWKGPIDWGKLIYQVEDDVCYWCLFAQLKPVDGIQTLHQSLALFMLCAGKPASGGFTRQSIGNTKFWWFLCWQLKKWSTNTRFRLCFFSTRNTSI